MTQNNNNNIFEIIDNLNAAFTQSQIKGIFQRPVLPQNQPAYHLPANIKALLELPVEHFRKQALNKSTSAAPLTNVAFILDESSSMSHGKEATVEGFNEQVKVVKDGAEQAGNTTFTDVRFSSEVRLVSLAGNIHSLKPLRYEDYKTDGCTALYDAIGATISALLNTPGIDDANTATLVTAFTDGEENKSRIFNSATLKAIIERLEATGRWTFALVGPLKAVTGLAGALSVNVANIAGFDVSSIADKRNAFSKVSSATASYMAMRSSGITQSYSLYNDQDLNSHK